MKAELETVEGLTENTNKALVRSEVACQIAEATAHLKEVTAITLPAQNFLTEQTLTAMMKAKGSNITFHCAEYKSDIFYQAIMNKPQNCLHAHLPFQAVAMHGLVPNDKSGITITLGNGEFKAQALWADFCCTPTLEARSHFCKAILKHAPCLGYVTFNLRARASLKDTNGKGSQEQITVDYISDYLEKYGAATELVYFTKYAGGEGRDCPMITIGFMVTKKGQFNPLCRVRSVIEDRTGHNPQVFAYTASLRKAAKSIDTERGDSRYLLPCHVRKALTPTPKNTKENKSTKTITDKDRFKAYVIGRAKWFVAYNKNHNRTMSTKEINQAVFASAYVKFNWCTVNAVGSLIARNLTCKKSFEQAA